MKIGILYTTKTGHSRKIAKAIAQELNIKAVDICTNPTLEEIDLLFIAGGIYGGKSSPKLLEFIKNISKQQVKTAALLTSSGQSESRQTEIRNNLKNQGIDVLENEFTCKGSILFVGMGHPNKKDLANVVDYVKKIVK